MIKRAKKLVILRIIFPRIKIFNHTNHIYSEIKDFKSLQGTIIKRKFQKIMTNDR